MLHCYANADAFSALTCWLGGRLKGIRPVKTEWWGVNCLERGADLHMAQLMLRPLTISCFSKIQTGLPSWYRLTRVVPDRGPLKGCMCTNVALSAFKSLTASLLCIDFSDT